MDEVLYSPSFLRGEFLGVGAQVAADSAWGALGRRWFFASDGPNYRHGISALPNHRNHWPAADVLQQPLTHLITVLAGNFFAVLLFRQRSRGSKHAQCGQAQTRGLKAPDYFPHQTPFHGIGFEHDKGSFHAWQSSCIVTVAR
jgi:hypothetical protein